MEERNSDFENSKTTISSLISERDTAISSMSTAVIDIDCLRNQLNEGNSTISKLNSLNEELMTSLHKKNSEIEELLTKMKNSDIVINSLEEEKFQLLDDNSKITDSFKQKINTLEGEKADLITNVSSFTNLVGDLNKENLSLKEMTECFQRDLAENSNRNFELSASMQEELSIKNEKIKELTLMIEEHDDKYNEYQRSVNILDHRNKELLTELEKITNNSLEIENKLKENEIRKDELSNQLTLLTNQIEDMKNSNDQLRDKSVLFEEDLRNREIEIGQQKENFEKEIFAVKQQNTLLFEEKKDLSNRLKVAELDQSSFTSQLQTANNEQTALVENLKDLSTDNNNLKDQISQIMKTYEESKTSFANESNNLQSVISDLRNENEDLRRTINTKNVHFGELQQTLSNKSEDLNDELHQVVNQLKEKQREYETIVDQLTTTKNNLDETYRLYDNIKVKLDSEIKQSSLRKDKIGELSTRVMELEGKLSERNELIKENLLVHNQTISTINEEKNGLTQQLKEHENINEKLNNNYQKILKNFTSKEAELNLKIKDNKNLRDKLQEYFEEINQLNLRIKTFEESKCDELLISVTEEKNTLETILNKTREENNTLNSNLKIFEESKYDEKIQSLTENNVSLQGNIEKLHEENNELLIKVKSFEESNYDMVIKKLATEIDEQKKKSSSYEMIIQNQQQDNELKVKEIIDLKNNLDKTVTQSESLQELNTSLIENLKTNKAETKQIETNYEQLLDNLRKDNENISTKYHKLTESNDLLLKRIDSLTDCSDTERKVHEDFVRDLQQKAANASSEVVSLTELTKTLKEKLEASKRDKVEEDRKMKNLKEENNIFSNKSLELKKENENLLLKYSAIQEHNNSLQERLKLAEESITSQHCILSELQSKLEGKEGQIYLLQDQCDKLSIEATNLKELNDSFNQNLKESEDRTKFLESSLFELQNTIKEKEVELKMFSTLNTEISVQSSRFEEMNNSLLEKLQLKEENRTALLKTSKDLQNEIEMKSNEISLLKDEVEKLTEQSRGLQNLNNSLIEKLKAYNKVTEDSKTVSDKRLSDLQSDVEKKGQNIQVLSSELERASANATNLQKMNDSLQDELLKISHTANVEKSQLVADLENLQRKLNEKTTENEKLLMKVENLSVQSHSFHDFDNSLTEKLKLAEEDKAKSEKSIKDLQNEIDKKASALLQSDKDREKLSAQSEGLQELNRSILEKLNSSNNTIAELKNSFNQNQTEQQNELDEKLKQIKSLSTEKERMNSELRQVQEENNLLKNRIEVSRGNKREYNTNIEKLHKEIQLEKDENHKKSEEIEKLSSQSSSLKELNSTLIEKLKITEKNLNDYKKDYEQTILNLQKESNQKTTQVDELYDQIKEISQRSSILVRENESLQHMSQNEYQRLKSETDDSQIKINQLHEEINGKSAEIKELGNRINDLLTESSNLKELNTTLLNKVKEGDTKCEELEKQKENLTKEIKKIELDNKKLNGKLKASKFSSKKTGERLEQTTRDLAEKHKNLQIEQEKLLEEISLSKKQIENLQEEKSNAEMEFAKFRDLYNSSRESLDDMVQQIHHEKDARSQDSEVILQLKTDNQTHSHNLELFKKDNFLLERRLSNVIEEKDLLQQENEKIKLTNVDLIKKLEKFDDLVGNNDQLVKSVEIYSRQVTNLSQEISEKQSKLSDSEENIQQMQTLINNLKQQIEELTELNNQLQSKLTQQENQFMITQNSLQMNNCEKEEVVKEIEQLRKSYQNREEKLSATLQEKNNLEKELASVKERIWENNQVCEKYQYELNEKDEQILNIKKYYDDENSNKNQLIKGLQEKLKLSSQNFDRQLSGIKEQWDETTRSLTETLELKDQIITERDNLKLRINQLEADVQESNENLEIMKSEYKARFNTQKEEIESHRNILNDVRCENSNKEVEINNLHEFNRKLKYEVESLSSSLEILRSTTNKNKGDEENEISELTDRNIFLSTENNHLKEELDRIESNHINTMNELDRYKESYNSLQVENKNLIASADTFTNDFQNALKQANEMQAENFSLREALSVMKSAAPSECSNSDLNQFTPETNKSISMHNCSNPPTDASPSLPLNLSNDAKLLKTCLDEINAQLTSRADLEKEFSSLRDLLLTCSNNTETVINLIESDNVMPHLADDEESADIQNQLEVKETALQNALGKLAELEKITKELADRKAYLEEQNFEKDSQLKQLQEDSDRKEQETAELENSLIEIREEKSKLESSLNFQTIEFENSLTLHKEEIQDIETKLKGQIDENTTFKETIKELNITLDKFEKDNHILLNEKTNSIELLHCKEEEIKDMEKRVGDFKLEIHELSYQCENIELEKSSMQTEINGLKVVKEQLENDIERILDEKLQVENSLKEQTNEFENTLATHEREINELNIICNNLTDDNEQLTNKIMELEEEKKQDKSEINRLKSVMDEKLYPVQTESIVENLKEEKANLESSLSDQQTQFTNQLTNLQKDLDELTTKYADLTEKYKISQSTVYDLENGKLIYENKVSELLAVNEEKTSIITKNNESLKRMQEELNDMNIIVKENKNEIEEKMMEINHLKILNDDMENDRCKLREESMEINRKLTEMERTSEDLRMKNDILVKNDDSESRIDNLNQYILKLKESIDKDQVIINDLQKTIDELTNSKVIIEENLWKNQTDFDLALNNYKKEMKDEIEKRDSSINRNERKIKEINRINEDLEKKLVNLQSESDYLNKELENINEAFKDKDSQNEINKKHFIESQQIINDLKKNNEKSKEAIDLITLERNSLEEENSKLTKEIEELKKDLKEKDDNKERSNNELKEKMLIIEELAKENFELNDQSNECLKEIEEIYCEKAEVKNLNESLEKTIIELNEKISILEEEHLKACNNLNRLENDIKQLRIEKDHLESTKLDMDNNLIELINNTELIKKEKEDILNQLEMNKEKFVKELMDKENIIENLRNIIEINTTESNQLKQNEFHYKEKINSMQNEIDHNKISLDENFKLIDDLRMENNNLTAINSQISSELKFMKGEMNQVARDFKIEKENLLLTQAMEMLPEEKFDVATSTEMLKYYDEHDILVRDQTIHSLEDRMKQLESDLQSGQRELISCIKDLKNVRKSEQNLSKKLQEATNIPAEVTNIQQLIFKAQQTQTDQVIVGYQKHVAEVENINFEERGVQTMKTDLDISIDSNSSVVVESQKEIDRLQKEIAKFKGEINNLKYEYIECGRPIQSDEESKPSQNILVIDEVQTENIQSTIEGKLQETQDADVQNRQAPLEQTIESQSVVEVQSLPLMSYEELKKHQSDYDAKLNEQKSLIRSLLEDVGLNSNDNEATDDLYRNIDLIRNALTNNLSNKEKLENRVQELESEVMTSRANFESAVLNSQGTDFLYNMVQQGIEGIFATFNIPRQIEPDRIMENFTCIMDEIAFRHDAYLSLKDDAREMEERLEAVMGEKRFFGDEIYRLKIRDEQLIIYEEQVNCLLNRLGLVVSESDKTQPGFLFNTVISKLSQKDDLIHSLEVNVNDLTGKLKNMEENLKIFEETTKNIHTYQQYLEENDKTLNNLLAKYQQSTSNNLKTNEKIQLIDTLLSQQTSHIRAIERSKDKLQKQLNIERELQDNLKLENSLLKSIEVAEAGEVLEPIEDYLSDISSNVNKKLEHLNNQQSSFGNKIFEKMLKMSETNKVLNNRIEGLTEIIENISEFSIPSNNDNTDIIEELVHEVDKGQSQLNMLLNKIKEIEYGFRREQETKNNEITLLKAELCKMSQFSQDLQKELTALREERWKFEAQLDLTEFHKEAADQLRKIAEYFQKEDSDIYLPGLSSEIHSENPVHKESNLSRAFNEDETDKSTELTALKTQLNGIVSSITLDLDAFKAKCDRLSIENTGLKERIHYLESKKPIKSNLPTDAVQLSQEVKMLEAINEECLKQNKSLKHKINLVLSQIETNKIETRAEVEKLYMNTIQELNLQKEELEARLSQYAIDNNKLDEQVTNLSRCLTKIENEKTSLNILLNDSKNQVENLQQQSNSSSIQIVETREEAETRIRYIEEHYGKVIVEKTKELRHSQDYVNKLTAAVTEMKSERDYLRIECTELKLQLETFKRDHFTETSDLHTENNSLKEKYQRVNNELNNLKIESNDYRNKWKKAVEELSSTKSVYEAIVKRNANLNKSSTRKNVEYDEVRKSYQETKMELDNLKGKYEILLNDFNRSENEKFKITEDCHIMFNDLQKLQEDNKALIYNTTQYLNEADYWRSKAITMENDLKDIETLKNTKIYEMELEINVLKKKCNSLSRELGKTITVKDQEKNSERTHRLEIDSLNESLYSFMEEKKLLENDLREKDRILQRLKQIRIDSIENEESFDVYIETIKDKINENQQLKLKNKELEQLKLSVEGLKEANRQAVEECQHIKSQLGLSIQSGRSLEENILGLKNEMKEKDGEIELLKEKIIEILKSGEGKVTPSYKDVQNAEIDDLKTQFGKLEEAYDKLLEEKNDLKLELNIINRSNRTVEKQLEELTSTVVEKNQEIANIKLENSSLILSSAKNSSKIIEDIVIDAEDEEVAFVNTEHNESLTLPFILKSYHALLSDNENLKEECTELRNRLQYLPKSPSTKEAEIQVTFIQPSDEMVDSQSKRIEYLESINHDLLTENEHLHKIKDETRVLLESMTISLKESELIENLDSLLSPKLELLQEDNYELQNLVEQMKVRDLVFTETLADKCYLETELRKVKVLLKEKLDEKHRLHSLFNQWKINLIENKNDQIRIESLLVNYERFESELKEENDWLLNELKDLKDKWKNLDVNSTDNQSYKFVLKEEIERIKVIDGLKNLESGISKKWFSTSNLPSSAKSESDELCSRSELSCSNPDLIDIKRKRLYWDKLHRKAVDALKEKLALEDQKK